MTQTSYTPQPGDRVRLPAWKPTYHVDVVAVARGKVFGFDSNGFTYASSVGLDWVKVETPTPLADRWTPFLTADWFSLLSFKTRAEAIELACTWKHDHPRAVLHVWSDETGDHAEIERYNP